MKYQSFFKQIFFVLTIAFFASCDKDAEEIGANIVGDDNFSTHHQTYEVTATNYKELGPADTGNLDINLFGVYDNPVFGKTTANFAAELLLATENPTIDLSLFDGISNVILSVPYYSKTDGTNTDGSVKYKLDSIYGKANAKLNLKIYRSRKYLNDLDPLSKLYSNDNSLFMDAVSDADILYDSNASGAEPFGFSADAQIEETIDEDTGVVTETNVTPRMKLELDKLKFEQYLFSAAGQSQLVSNGIFRQYFRGLYFNVSLNNPAENVLGKLNFKSGKVTINYKMKKAAGSSIIEYKTMVLNMNGKTINLFDKTNALTVENPEQKIVLNNGQNAMAIIDLFPNQADLDELRANRRLINDASITFYVDRETMGNDVNTIEPKRIYLYDLSTNAPILDFYYDQTVNSNYTAFGKQIHGGILEVDSNDRGVKYKIKLTNHIMSLLVPENPAANTKLGLVVTENINNITTKALKTEKILTPTLTLKEVPQMSLVQPFSTVLWGSNIPADSPNYDKRVKLEIIYSKPN